MLLITLGIDLLLPKLSRVDGKKPYDYCCGFSGLGHRFKYDPNLDPGSKVNTYECCTGYPPQS